MSFWLSVGIASGIHTEALNIMFSQVALTAAAFGYLLLLFAIAYYGDRRRARGRSIIANPMVYSLSLAVYVTALTFFGSVGRAATQGISFLTVYLGPTLGACAFWFVLRKILRIAKQNNLTTLSDFLSLRYGKGAGVGALATIGVLLALIPYTGLQLKSVSVTFDLLGNLGDGLRPLHIPFYQDTGFFAALVMAAFSIMFGARHLDPTERHEGMVAAMAFESLIKLAAFLAIGFLVAFGLYRGLGDIFTRICQTAQFCDLTRLNTGLHNNYAALIAQTVVSMGAMLFLPREFHMAVVENTDERHLLTAMWLFPLYLFCIVFFVAPIAFGGLLMGLPAAAADTFVLRIPMESGHPYLALAAFLGGLSAATAMVVTSSIAVSTMVLNSLILPTAIRLKAEKLITPHLLAIKRTTILFIVLLGYTSYRLIGSVTMLVDMGLLAYCGVIQLAPPILGALYWKKANRCGAIAGLALGIIACGYLLVFPAFIRAGWFPGSILETGPFGIAVLNPVSFLGLSGLDTLPHAFFWSMFFNVGAFLTVSWLTSPSPAEVEQTPRFVEVFGFNGVMPREQRYTYLPSLAEFTRFMEKFIGRAKAAEVRENLLVEIAVPEKDWGDQEKLKLASLVERTIAGVIGPAAAQVIMEGYLSSTGSHMEKVFDLFGHISNSLEESQQQLKRRVAELSILYEAAQRLTSSLYLPDLIEGVLDLLKERLMVERCAVRLIDDDGLLRIKSARGLPAEAGDAAVRPEMRSFLGQCLLTPQVVLVSDSSIVSDRVEGMLEDEIMNSFVLAPITTETMAMGVLSAASSQKGYFAKEHMEFFQSLTRQMGSVVRSAQLVAHHIRNPVYAIDGFAHRLLKKLPEGSEFKGYAEIIMQEAHRLQQMVNDIVETAVVFVPGDEENDLNQVIRGALSLIRTDIKEKNITVKLELAKKLPALSLDVGNMKRAILQVASNSLEAMSAGGTLQIKTAIKDEAVELQINDTGKGIPPDILPRIFTAFFSTKPSGPGIGLPIVHKIITQHGGKIFIDSTENVGTAVTILLPIPQPV
jgi:sigma-B regulation protein RsbU (phosphoserine phosphatase)